MGVRGMVNRQNNLKNEIDKNIKTRRACVRGAHDKTSITVHPTNLGQTLRYIRVPSQFNIHSSFVVQFRG